MVRMPRKYFQILLRLFCCKILVKLKIFLVKYFIKTNNQTSPPPPPPLNFLYAYLVAWVASPVVRLALSIRSLRPYSRPPIRGRPQIREQKNDYIYIFIYLFIYWRYKKTYKFHILPLFLRRLKKIE